jgi:hypothetical protein
VNIEMSGYADVRADVRTVKDLRDLVSFLDKNRVRHDAQIDWGSGFVYILVADNARGEFIECGDHIPPDLEFDVILNTHSHPVPETYEEALEMQLDYPAQYEWPARDRSKGKGK